MKRVILLAVIQAVVLFFIIGALAYALKALLLQLSSSCLCAYCRSLAFCFGLCDGELFYLKGS